MWGVIWILFMSFLVFGIFTGIGWSYWLYNLYCVFGVILFGIYILFDTQMIIGGKRLQLSMDDYVIGALILYIDIIQMFLYLLSLFGRRWNSTITWLSFKPKIDIFIKLINLFIYLFCIVFMFCLMKADLYLTNSISQCLTYNNVILILYKSSSMDQYKLEYEKGSGTFSVVFTAISLKTGKHVAIKCMKKKFDSL